MRFIVAVFLLIPLALSADEPAHLIKNLRSCSLITEPDARLKCYDGQFHQPTIAAEKLPAKKPPEKPIAKSPTPAPSLPADLSKNKDKSILVNAPTRPQVKAEKSVLGEKYLNRELKDEEQEERIPFTLIKADKDSRGRWQFYFKNGQAWRQVEKKYLKIPDLPTTANISVGFLGSHNLHIGESKRLIKIKRLK